MNKKVLTLGDCEEKARDEYFKNTKVKRSIPMKKKWKPFFNKMEEAKDIYRVTVEDFWKAIDKDVLSNEIMAINRKTGKIDIFNKGK